MKKAALVAYSLALTAVVIAVFIKPDLITRAEAKAGIIQTANLHLWEMIKYQARIDPLVPKGSAIFLGDSITQGLAAQAVVANAINYGIGGATTSELLIALPSYKALSDASAVYLEVGVNDIAQRKTDGIAGRLAEIVAHIPAGTPLVWSYIIPADDPKVPAEKVRDANAVIESLCNARPKCRIIDTTSIFSNADGSIKRELYLPDGLHISTEGYKAWIAALRSAD